MSEHLDKFGREIQVGDLVVYPCTKGYAVDMECGTILELVWGPKYSTHGEPKLRIEVPKRWGVKGTRVANLGNIERVVSISAFERELNENRI